MLTKTPAPKLMAVPPEYVPDFWPVARPLIERAYQRVDIFMPTDFVERLIAGNALLWVVAVGVEDVLHAFITELAVRPSGAKVCKIVVSGGKQMNEWLPLQAEFERYAKAEGCSKIVAEGRPGWARALHGYKEIRRVIEKDL